MKKLYLLLFLAFFANHAHAQNSQERCQQGSCSGYGAPIGACVGSFIYSDISQNPVQAYSCVAGVWGKQGGGAATETRTITTNIIKSQIVAANTCTTLFSATGVGSIEHTQIAMISGDVGATRDATINFTIDGNSFSAPLGLWFANYGTEDGPSFIAPPTFSRNLGISYAQNPGTPGFGGERKEFIPYYSSATVTYCNNSKLNSTTFYSQVDAYSGAVPANLHTPLQKYWHLYYVPYLNNYLTYQQSINMLPSVSGPGQVESMILAVSAASTATAAATPTWLEAYPELLLDGSIYGAGGTEDWFGGQFYFVGGRPVMDEKGATRVGYGTAGTFYTTMYHFFHDYPAIFNSTLSSIWQDGISGIAAPSVNMGSLVTYYTQSPSTTPAPPSSAFLTSMAATLYAQYTPASLAGGGNTSGSTVVSWPDASGNGHNLTTIIGAPKYEATGTINSGPTVRFAGLADALSNTTAALPTTTVGRTVWAVFNIGSSPFTMGHTGVLFSGYSGASLIQGSLAAGPGNATFPCEYSGGTGCIQVPGASLATGTTYIAAYTFNGAYSKICINGNGCTYVPAGTGASIWTSLVKMGYDGGAGFFAGDIAELDVYLGLQTATQATTTGAALAAAYGVTAGSGGWF